MQRLAHVQVEPPQLRIRRPQPAREPRRKQEKIALLLRVLAELRSLPIEVGAGFPHSTQVEEGFLLEIGSGDAVQPITRDGELHRLPDLLRSSLLDESGLLLSDSEEDWIVKVNTMADMLSLPIDQELATAVARNLSDSRWPVRLMAAYLLARSSTGDFGKVLDWMAQNDANEFVRALAVSLRPAGPEGRSSSPLGVRGASQPLP